MMLVIVMPSPIWHTLLTEGLLGSLPPSPPARRVMANPIVYLSPVGWRLLQLLLFVIYHFLKTFWVNLFKPFLSLLASMVFMAFSIFVILLSSGLRAGCKMTFILAILFHSKVLSPIFSFLKHLLHLLAAWLLTIFLAIFHQAYISSLRLLKHLRHLRHRPTVALVILGQWSYYGLIVYCQKNAYQVIWRALEYQMLFILLLGCLDGLWAAVCKVTQLILTIELPGQDPLESIISSLPPPVIPLSHRFPGSYPSILAQLAPSYRPLTVQVNVEDGTRSCYFEPPAEPLTTTLSHRHHHHQCHAKQRRDGGLLPPSRNSLTQQIKTICVTLMIFYFFGDSIFAKIKK